MKEAKRKALLFPGGSNVGKAKPMPDVLAPNATRIEVCYQPQYSPALNASEFFNGDLMTAVARGIVPRDRAERRRAALSHSRRIHKSPERVHKCCEHEDVRYAA